MPSTTQTEPIALSNIAGGALEESFQDALALLAREIGRAHEGVYQPNRDKEIEAEIGIRVRVSHNVENGVTIVSGSIEKVALPKRARRGSVAYLAGESVHVDRAQQVSMFDTAAERGEE